MSYYHEKIEIKKDIILTIAVPTYNSEKHIEKTLENITSNIKEFSNEIEVIISDNGSEDKTGEIIKRYAKKYQFIQYFRNKKNFGFDKNVDLAVYRANGIFIWLLADDDLITSKKEIKVILETIKTHPDVATIFVNFKMNPPIKCLTNCLCDNGDIFFYMNSFRSGLLSSNIINKNIWMQTNVQKYIGSGWIHVGYLVDAMVKNKGYIIADYCFSQNPMKIKMRWGKNGSFFYTGLELVKIYKNMKILGYKKKNN